MTSRSHNKQSVNFNIHHLLYKMLHLLVPSSSFDVNSFPIHGHFLLKSWLEFFPYVTTYQICSYKWWYIVLRDHHSTSSKLENINRESTSNLHFPFALSCCPQGFSCVLLLLGLLLKKKPNSCACLVNNLCSDQHEIHLTIYVQTHLLIIT